MNQESLELEAKLIERIVERRNEIVSRAEERAEAILNAAEKDCERIRTESEKQILDIVSSELRAVRDRIVGRADRPFSLGVWFRASKGVGIVVGASFEV